MAIKNTKNLLESKNDINKKKLLEEMEKKACELSLKRKGRNGNFLDDCIEAVKAVREKYNVT